jgi:malate dehydrogenase (oxaloacetate-decarboxylating)
LLHAPTLNKGTAFTEAERLAFGLHGLLPPAVETLEEQCARAYEAFGCKDNDLERHIYLRALQDTNEVLFYGLLLEHVEEMLPLVYTPVVAQACQRFSEIYRRPRGLFVSYPLRDSIPTLLRNRPNPDVDVIVVTDGERILGIGDQGVGGMGIPIGKLTLYSLIGGIHPARTLPVVLDAGTNNRELLRDPEYLGWRHERVTGAYYHDFLARFVQAVRQELPGTLLQWEDFATPNARPILERYRDQLLTFNDDIQGTAAVTLGTLLAAVAVTGRSLRDQQIVFFGAGSAGVGVADYLRAALIQEGLTDTDARRRIWMIDKDGLLHAERTDLSPEQHPYAQPVERLAGWACAPDGAAGLAEVIQRIEAMVLIGLSTVGGAFTEAVVREMARKVERPIIFPLSNPTANAEARPEDLLRWTDGRALVATGSPFAPVAHGGRTIPIAQCNNVFVFPAVGLGVVAAGARHVTDGMLLAAARALAQSSPAHKDPAGALLPAVRDLRQVAVDIAVAVGLEAQRAGLAPATSADELHAKVCATQWRPAYPTYVRAESGSDTTGITA